MKRKQLYMAALIAATHLTLTSCDKYLDSLPDNRMELTTTEDYRKLLVNAYPYAYPAYLLETCSDNTDKYNNPAWDEAELMQRQAWEWNVISESGSADSPRGLWDANYKAISIANDAIAFCESQPSGEEVNAILGEALLCRAYAIFTLTNIFCMAYDNTTASTHMGMPYPTRPQERVSEQVARGTLEETYKQIAADIDRGIALVGNTYEKPKFHFTPTSGHAFAARFYLYYQKYDKAVEHATAALGDTPTGKMRDWSAWSALSANKQIQPNDYISTGNNTNFLTLVTDSEWGVINGPYSYGERYAHGLAIAENETVDAAGPWGTAKSLNYKTFKNTSLANVCVRKIPYAFEIKDIVAGTGYAHSVIIPFTTEETLLVRAEAQIMLNQYDKALQDINAILSKFHKQGKQLTLAEVKTFYAGISYYKPTAPTVKKRFNTSFGIEPETQEPLLQCLLQLRRLLTLHEGLRMQDVKRYGITIYRRVLNEGQDVLEVTDSLKAGDPRSAIQIPAEVISAGLPANPRP